LHHESLDADYCAEDGFDCEFEPYESDGADGSIEFSMEL